jgi:hypothetical protein
VFGLDETLLARVGTSRTQSWLIPIVDMCGGQLLELVPSRDSNDSCCWLAA